MTAKQSPSAFLEQWVLHDGKPITARLLSILQECHISVAHKHMSNFHQEMSSRGKDSVPFTSWILKGSLKGQEESIIPESQDSSATMDIDSDGSRIMTTRQAFMLVTQDKLQETEATFETMEVKEVYSFSPRLSAGHSEAHVVAAISQLTTIQHDIHNRKEYSTLWESIGRGRDLGAIPPAREWNYQGKPKIAAQLGPSQPIAPAKGEPAATKDKTKPKAEIETRSITKELSIGKKKETAKMGSSSKASSAKSKRKLVDSDEEGEESGKDVIMADADEDDEEDAGPIGYRDEAARSKSTNDVPASTGGAIRKRADAGDKMSKEDDQRSKRRQELIDMMEEDGNGQADPPVPAAETTSTSMMKGTENDQTSREEAVKEETPEAEASSTSNGTKKRVRKQRKVIRKERTKNAKGYTVTQDVEGYESYSSDESDAPAPVPPASKTKKTDKPTKEVAVEEPAPASIKQEAPLVAKTNSDGGGQTNPPTAASKKGSGTGSGGQRKLSSFFSKGGK